MQDGDDRKGKMITSFFCLLLPASSVLFFQLNGNQFSSCGVRCVVWRILASRKKTIEIIIAILLHHTTAENDLMVWERMKKL